MNHLMNRNEHFCGKQAGYNRQYADYERLSAGKLKTLQI
jgi:hypothetical protein